MKIKRVITEYIDVPDIFTTGESFRMLGQRIHANYPLLCNIKNGKRIISEKKYEALKKAIHG